VINKGLFCPLATSANWQTWLYEYDKSLYREFITQLRQSTGCSKNSEIMLWVLEAIRTKGGSVPLEEFLQRTYPNVVTQAFNGVVFPGYMPGLLTFPHRVILIGPKPEKLIKDFVVGKIHVDSLVIGSSGYVEYLLPHESQLFPDIPAANWFIKAYRKNSA
jgi:hypothetical protein